jgi:hypothetical protein
LILLHGYDLMAIEKGTSPQSQPMQQTQRELFAKSLMDLGNLIAVALVFGQFVTGQPCSMVAFGTGLIVTAALDFGGFTFSRERGGDIHG